PCCGGEEMGGGFPGCMPEKRGFFRKVKEWFCGSKGRCYDCYAPCGNQPPRPGLFARIGNVFCPKDYGCMQVGYNPDEMGCNNEMQSFGSAFRYCSPSHRDYSPLACSHSPWGRRHCR